MKKAILIVLLIALSGTFLYAKVNDLSGKQAIQQGNVAPEFELKTLAGKTVKLSDYRGKRVILNFWATWCPPCREEMPDMQKFYEKYKDQNIEILAVNLLESGSLNETKAFVQEFDIQFPVLLDEKSKISNIYHTTAIPTSFLINSNGVIEHKIVGAMSYDWMVNQVTGMKETFEFTKK